MEAARRTVPLTDSRSKDFISITGEVLVHHGEDLSNASSDNVVTLARPSADRSDAVPLARMTELVNNNYQLEEIQATFRLRPEPLTQAAVLTVPIGADRSAPNLFTHVILLVFLGTGLTVSVIGVFVAHLFVGVSGPILLMCVMLFGCLTVTVVADAIVRQRRQHAA